MTEQTRRKFSADFKTKVVLEALKEHSSIEELARKYELHPTQINTWKRDFLHKASSIFADKGESADNAPAVDTDKLYAQIGQMKVEIDFLKKKLF